MKELYDYALTKRPKNFDKKKYFKDNDHENDKSYQKTGGMKDVSQCAFHRSSTSLIKLRSLDPRVNERIDNIQQERGQQHHNRDDQGTG